jgi:hypothetical protein
VLPLLELRRRVQQVNIVLKNLISHKIHIKKKKKKNRNHVILKTKRDLDLDAEFHSPSWNQVLENKNPPSAVFAAETEEEKPYGWFCII